MKKVFESVIDSSRRTLEVSHDDSGLNLMLAIRNNGLTESLIIINPSEGAKLMLAIGEAMGYTRDGEDYLSGAMGSLYYHCEEIEVQEKSAQERAELEAEALELVNARREVMGFELHHGLSDLSKKWQEAALAVARKARELADKRAEK